MSWSDMNTNQLTKLNDIPLKALTYDTRCKIGYNLNSNGRVVVLKDVDNGYDIVIENNIKGIAELAGFTGKQIFNIILQSDPTMDFMQQWSERKGTVGQFCEYLMQIQRLDILEECGQDILNDCREFKTRKMNTKSCTSSLSSYFPLKCSDHLSENLSNSFDEFDLKTAEEKAGENTSDEFEKSESYSSDSSNHETKKASPDISNTKANRRQYTCSDKSRKETLLSGENVLRERTNPALFSYENGSHKKADTLLSYEFVSREMTAPLFSYENISLERTKPLLSCDTALSKRVNHSTHKASLDEGRKKTSKHFSDLNHDNSNNNVDADQTFDLDYHDSVVTDDVLCGCGCSPAEQHRKENRDRISSDSGNEEFKAVTIDDVLTGHDRTRYHAFICYSVESENDRAFVKDLIEVLEKGRGLKLFIPGRDDIPGSAEHSVNAYIIEKRCGTSVVLLSKDFLRSEVCEFQLKFTHALSPAARSHRLIPVIIHKNVQVPRFLGFLAMCDFSSTDFSDWVWNRLFSAIQTNNDTKNRNGSGILEDSLKDISFPVTRRLNE